MQVPSLRGHPAHQENLQLDSLLREAAATTRALVEALDGEGWTESGVRTDVSRLVMKWVRQRCQLAPAKTDAIASLRPR